MKKSKIIIGVIIFFLATICFITYNGKIVAQEKETGRNNIKQQVMLMESLYLIKDLKLTGEQVKELIPLIKEAKVIKEEMDIPSNLIEHVAGRIQHRLKERFPQSTQQTISLSKFNPPLGGQIEKVTIVL